MSATAPLDTAGFVSAHQAEAAALGRRLAGLVDDPETFLATLDAGLVQLSDPAYGALLEAVSPGIPAPHAVRGPLREAVVRPLRTGLRRGSGASALWLAQRLAGAADRELRLFALPCLRRALADDPEQSWQLLRRMGARAEDWIEVDSLADVWAQGILAEDFRWAELEQLVYSRRTYERRLVGATLATLPHRLPGARRGDLRGEPARRAMELVRQLMGDAEVIVQKALSWAIREWTHIAPEAAAGLLREEAREAVRRADGARAWVIRDSLSRQPTELAAELRAALAGLRRDRHAPSTSLAAARSAQFAALIEAHDAIARQGDRYARSRA